MVRLAVGIAKPMIFFGLLGTLMVAAGLYGVASFSAHSRYRDFGIMRALGATAWPIVRTIVSEGVGVVLRGTAWGAACAALVALFLPQAFLAGISSTDIVAFVAVPLCAIGVSLMAMLPSAWRAYRKNPLTAIRQD